MAKTIQVRVDEALKESADALFTSLGLDTSTAIRMFLMASMETRGLPFAVRRQKNSDADLLAAIERHKNGTAVFLTREECRANALAAIQRGAAYGT
jgi:DNA-damage-inducible protein J